MRGNLDHAVGIEGLFRLPNGRDPLLRIHEVPRRAPAGLDADDGRGPRLLLMHGLGATKASFFDMAAALSRSTVSTRSTCRGSAPPAGHGALRRWYASPVARHMDVLGIERAHLVGNSMGGRVALELGLDGPTASAGSCSWPGGRLGAARLPPARPAPAPRARPAAAQVHRDDGRRPFWDLFADPDLVDPALADIVVDEFQRIYGSPGARLAFLSSARNIYLESPFGAQGFYPRLSELRAPALFVWGSTTGWSRAVPPPRRALAAERGADRARGLRPRAAGRARRATNGLVGRFFSSVDPLGSPRLQAA